MVFKNNIPQPPDFLNITSQPDLLANMAQLDASFGIDHKPFSDNTMQNGYHTTIHQPFRVGDPVAILNVGQLYTKQAPTNTELFYENDVGIVTQLTSSTGGGAGNNLKAWASVNGSSGAILGSQSFNVSGIVHNSTGNFTVTLTNAMPDQFFGVLISVDLFGQSFTSLDASYHATANNTFTIKFIQPATGSSKDPTNFTFQLLHT
ncbi:MAG: hypothetical protein ACHP6H_06725 [Legionellales bacterium]